MQEPGQRPVDLTSFASILSENACKARYGVAYVRSICSQAGVPLLETSPDEDAVAIDCNLILGSGSVMVQVKCTSQFRLRSRSASWPMELHWQNCWSKFKVPVYFVLVILDERDRSVWLDHSLEGTFHRAAAYWRRVDINNQVDRIHIDKNQRLTTATFQEWQNDLEACFTSAVAIQHAG